MHNSRAPHAVAMHYTAKSSLVQDDACIFYGLPYEPHLCPTPPRPAKLTASTSKKHRKSHVKSLLRIGEQHQNTSWLTSTAAKHSRVTCMWSQAVTGTCVRSFFGEFDAEMQKLSSFNPVCPVCPVCE